MNTEHGYRTRRAWAWGSASTVERKHPRAWLTAALTISFIAGVAAGIAVTIMLLLALGESL